MAGRRLVQGLLVALVLATGATMAFGASTSTATFNPYNPDWDGGQELRAIATSDPAGAVWLRNASRYPLDEPEGTVVLALSPPDPGADGERRAREFVRSGGTLVVADDGAGGGNDLLAAVGAGARVDGDTLRDDQNYGPSPGFPVASNVTGHPLTRHVDELTLNYASAIEPRGATTLVSSSGLSYLDRNGNERFDGDERLGARPVVTVEPVGDGRVVAVSDSSLFLNAMLERSDNRAFARALLGQGSRVVLDTPGDDGVPPAAAAGLALRRSPLVQVGAATAALAVVFLAARRPERPAAVFARLRSAIPLGPLRVGSGLPAPTDAAADRGSRPASPLAGPIERDADAVEATQSSAGGSPQALDSPSTSASPASGAPAGSPEDGPTGKRSGAASGDRAESGLRAAGQPPAHRSRLRRVTEAIITRSEIRDYDD